MTASFHHFISFCKKRKPLASTNYM